MNARAHRNNGEFRQADSAIGRIGNDTETDQTISLK